MESDIHQLIQAVHDHPARLVLVTAGAGGRALSDLLSVAGASRTLLEALVPYSQTSFDEFLGQMPAQYVAGDTARLMAGRALTRARWLETEKNPLLGLGCTATIVTDRPKRGEHRARIATWQAEQLVCYGLHLKKGARDRTGEENLISRVMLNALARACGLNISLSLPLIEGDHLDEEVSNFTRMAQTLERQEIDYFGIQADGRIHTTDLPPKAVLSGSFNPLHKGHLGLAQVAGRILGASVTFELAVINADKPPLPTETVLDRMAQFAGRWPVIASNAPTFVEKARLYPGATFIVGYDTAERILQPHYYHDSQAKLMAALNEIRARGCRFLVAGRVDDEGNFRQMDNLDIPSHFKDLFQAIPSALFHQDISSTELRESGRRGSR